MNRKILKKCIILVFIITTIDCNVWDNIFSQTLASSPIILSQSIHFKFPINYEDYQLDGSLDFNNDLKILTFTASKSLLIIDYQLLRVQIDVQQFLITATSVLRGCEKYKLVLSEDDKGKVQKINIQSKTFLVNLLFEYLQRSKNNKTMNQYVFKPDLIQQHTQQHQQYETNPLLIVDQNGNIVKIYENRDKKKQIPFKLKSTVNKKLQCDVQVKQFTKQELLELIQNSIQNKDYEKIPGFDADKAPKIPGIKDFDFSKLPKTN